MHQLPLRQAGDWRWPLQALRRRRPERWHARSIVDAPGWPFHPVRSLLCAASCYCYDQHQQPAADIRLRGALRADGPPGNEVHLRQNAGVSSTSRVKIRDGSNSIAKHRIHLLWSCISAYRTLLPSPGQVIDNFATALERVHNPRANPPFRPHTHRNVRARMYPAIIHAAPV